MECTLSASAVGCIITAFIVVSITYFWIWRPYKLHTFYRRQRLKGPEYRPFIGNTVDIWKLRQKFAKIKRYNFAHPAADVAVRSLPHLFHWSKLYGSMFTYMEGSKVKMCVIDVNIIQQLLVNKSDCYRRNPAEWLWGNKDGIGRSLRELRDKSKAPNVISHCDPHHLSKLRRIWGPGTDYNSSTVQVILQRAIDHCKTLVGRWENLIDEGCDVADGRVEVDAKHDIAKTSMDIVLTNLIGSTLSSQDLEMINSILDTERDELEKATAPLPLFSGHFGGRRSNKDGWLNRLLTGTAQSRMGRFESIQSRQNPRDLMDLMVSSCYSGGTLDVKQLVDDCEMMVEAQNSTTCLINNTLLLLGRHTNWQVQARAEVQDIRPLISTFDGNSDDLSWIYPKLTKLKTLNMILNESLRLAPPIICIEKLCQKRNRLGKYTVLPGTVMQIPIVLLHHSHELWGEDSSSFRPDRLENESGRRKPFALLPFSAGPSVCLGYNSALLEAKMVLASIVSNFSFRLSPDSHSGVPYLSIRKLQLDDFAQAAKERLGRSRSNMF